MMKIATVIKNTMVSYQNHRADMNYNAIFDTGCRRLESCTQMQPKNGMQPLLFFIVIHLHFQSVIDVNVTDNIINIRIAQF